MMNSCLIKRSVALICILAALFISTSILRGAAGQKTSPADEPRVIDPGTVGRAPSDAIILFDGKDLSQWNGTDGSAPKWLVKDGVMTVVSGAGNIASKQEFGDIQLHLEWATPTQIEGEGQGRGNSGVFLMGRYEVQILDSYQNKTYVDGQAGAVYKQYAPLVNASRRPGEWQTYDIIFHAPAFDDQGQVTKKARLTLLHNGVLIQDHVELTGPTSLKGGTVADQPPYTKHPPQAPLILQDHRNPMRYRNIWVRRL